MLENNIIESIDYIDSCKTESAIFVIESMIYEVNKYCIMTESYETDTLYQEGDSLLDRVKKQEKKDENKLITILKFVPRLIIEVFNSIANFFKDKKIGDEFKSANKKFEDIKDKREKEKRVKELNKMFNGKCECYLDEKSGKIKFKRDKSLVLETIGWFSGASLGLIEIIKRFKKKFDYTNPSEIRKFTDDFDAILHGDKSVKKFDIFRDGLDAIGEILGDQASLTVELNMLSQGLDKLTMEVTRHDVLKGVDDEKRHTILKELNNLSSKIAGISTKITTALGLLKLFTKWGNVVSDAADAFQYNVELDKTSLNNICDKYVDDNDLKSNNPKKENESEDKYKERLREVAMKDMIAKHNTKELREQYPKTENESIEDYHERINGIIINNIVGKDGELGRKAIKQEKNRIKNEEKEKAKQEYLKQKQERRNGNNSSNNKDDNGSD